MTLSTLSVQNIPDQPVHLGRVDNLWLRADPGLMYRGKGRCSILVTTTVTDVDGDCGLNNLGPVYLIRSLSVPLIRLYEFRVHKLPQTNQDIRRLDG